MGRANHLIYTLRTFHVDRKDYAEFVRISEETIWPGIEKQGARALGLFVVVIGGPERILLMTRYDSLAHWQETRSWNELGSSAGGRAALVKETEMIALRPLTKRMPSKDHTGEPGIYTLRSFEIRDNDVDRLVDLSVNHWWHWAEKGLKHEPLGQWISIIAPETRIYMMTRYDDMNHWETTRSPSPEPS